MIDYKFERKLFFSEAATLNIFSQIGSEAYARYRLFMFDAISAVANQVGEMGAIWLAVVQRAAKRELNNQELLSYRLEVEAYRQAELVNVDPNIRRCGDAFTILLIYALEDWPKMPELHLHANIAQYIDEFVDIFISNFGKAKELLGFLKQRFDMPNSPPE